MHRRSIVSAACAMLATFVLLAGVSRAEPVAMSAAEIETLLAGNTISGTWNGSGYQQYFEIGGMTMYLPANGANDAGKWRVNAGDQAYESWWRSTGWTSYKVLRDGETFLWVDSGGKHHPFTVQAGKQVTW